MKTTILLNLRKVFLLILLLFGENFSVKAQVDDCTLLVQQGVREYVIDKTYYDNYEEVKSAVIEAYEEFTQSNDEVKAKAKYKAIFKGSGSYSKERMKSIYEFYKSDFMSVSQITQVTESQRSFIDPNYTAMFIACQEAKGQNVRLKIEPTSDNRSITISASYLTSTDNLRPKVTGIDYNQDLLDVSGNLKDAALSKRRLDGSKSLIITRKDIRNTAFQVGNEMLLANEHQLTLDFEIKSISITFPKIYPEPPKVELVKGVGEISASMLEENEFKSLYNKNGQIWVLADGSPVPENTAYFKRGVRENLPDLRGMFLRGANNGRNDGKQNPDNIELGLTQDDAIKPHKHKKGADATSNGGSEHHYWGGNTSGEYEYSEVNKETRPRNVTVNYFIRIN